MFAKSQGRSTRLKKIPDHKRGGPCRLITRTKPFFFTTNYELVPALSWVANGHRPVAPVKIGYESVYLYLTLCPFTGKGSAAFLPNLNGACFGWFVKQVQACLHQKSLFVADSATAHQRELFDSERLTFERLPAACPELNPAERFFKEVHRHLKFRVLLCDLKLCVC